MNRKQATQDDVPIQTDRVGVLNRWCLHPLEGDWQPVAEKEEELVLSLTYTYKIHIHRDVEDNVRKCRSKNSRWWDWGLMGQQMDGNIHAHFKAEVVSSDHLECGHRNFSWGKNVWRTCHVTGNRWYKERQKRQTSAFPNQTPTLSRLQKHLKKRKHCVSCCTKRKSNMNQSQYMQATKQTHQTHGHLDREEITSQSFGAQCGLSILPLLKKNSRPSSLTFA